MSMILATLKRLLGTSAEDTEFDSDILTFASGAFASLSQMHIGLKDGFTVTADSEWDDLGLDEKVVGEIKMYVYLKVKLLFDGGSMSSAMMDAVKRQIAESEWRITAASDMGCL